MKGKGAKHVVMHDGAKEVHHHHMKKGGKAMKKGGKVDGGKSKHKMGKYARGGKVEAAAKMTPTSPLSGAAPRDVPKAIGTDKENN